LRLGDGSYIPNAPNAVTIKEKVERHYAKKQSQFYLGYDDEGDAPSSSVPKTPSQYIGVSEDPARRRARLELELDLKEREEALELKQLKLEREEKKKEQNGKASTRAAHVLDLLEQVTDEDIAALRSSGSGFH